MRTATDALASDSAPTIASPRPGVSGAASAGLGPGPVAPKGLPLKTQYFLSAALLVVVTLGLALALATWRANQIAEESIRSALRKIPGDVAVYRTGLESQLKATLRSVAEEPGIKAIFDSPVGTLWDTAKDKAGILNAKTFFFFDRSGVLVARSDRPPVEEERRSFRNVLWVAEPLDDWKESAATIREGTSLAVVAAAPVIAGDPEKGEARLVGVVAASIPLDGARARELRDLTGGQVAFVADTAKRARRPSSRSPRRPTTSAGTCSSRR